MDNVLGGGFAVGAVHELIAANAGAAVRSLALRAVAPALGGNRWLLYVDTGDDLYPPALLAYGVPLARLLVVRTTRTGEALWVCEEALRCRAIAAIVVPLRQLETQVSRRLQLAAEAGGGVLFALCRAAPNGTFAATRLAVEVCPPQERDSETRVPLAACHCSVSSANVDERAARRDAPALRPSDGRARQADWSAFHFPGLKGRAPASEFASVGRSSALNARDRKEALYFAPALTITVLKLRGGRAGQTLTLEWDDAAGVVHSSPAARDAARTA